MSKLIYLCGWIKYVYLSLRCKTIKPFAGNNYSYALGFSSPDYSKLSIGAHCSFGGRVLLASYEVISIGDYCMFASGVSVLTATHDYGVYPMSKSFIAKPVTIGSNCWIGTNAIILPGIAIGNNCVVGAGAVVTKDIPNNSVVAGVPARTIKTIEVTL